jgi:hypothetical protein
MRTFSSYSPSRYKVRLFPAAPGSPGDIGRVKANETIPNAS